MPQRDRPKPNPTGQPGDDFRRITGIGPALERRLHDAGILTYQDLAEHTPEEIATALADVTGVSAERIASQDWIGQAHQLAEPPPPPEPSEPSQRYASFHVEFLLDPDNSIRRTKVHDYQRDTDNTWPGWDEDRLLTLLRDQIPLTAAPKSTDTADLQPPPTPPTSQPPATLPSTSTGQPPPATPSASLPPSFLRIEELTPISDGQRGYIRRPDEPTSVRLTLRVNPTDMRLAATFDFTVDIAARSKLGDNRRWPLGTTHGAIRGNDPLSVELTGPPLPPGLYRLVATVAVYPADHTVEAQSLFSRDVSGDLIHVADVPTQTAPAGDLTSSNS
jgi:Helix-hairpin-helix domain